MSNDFSSLAGSLVTILGTIYLVSATGKLIKQASKGTYMKSNKRMTKRSNYKIHTRIKMPDMGIRL